MLFSIYSKTVTEHLTYVKEILQLLQTSEVALKLAECIFSGTAVSILGHTIPPGQMDLDKRNLVAIERATAPENQTELPSLLGRCSVYRRFVLGFVKFAASLNKKTSKEEPFESELLTDGDFDAFQNPSTELTPPPILALHRQNYE